MAEVVIVEAVRTPVGRRNGGLSSMHSIDLLGAVQREVLERAGVDPLEVGQVVGGCVGQVGMQAMNVTRNAWLTAGLPIEVAATTVDAQCGSSQQATNLAYSLVASGVIDSALACGVELMSRVPMGATIPKDPNVGKPVNKNYWAAPRVHVAVRGRRAHRRHTGPHPRRLRRVRQAVPGPRRAAWAEDRFGTQILEIDAPTSVTTASPLDTTHRVDTRRRPARDHARRARAAQADRPSRRRAHRGHVVADRRRRRRGAAHDAREGERARPHAARDDRRRLPGRLRPGAHARRPDPRDPEAPRRQRPHHRRHRHRRDQRGVRVGRARVGAGPQGRHGTRQPQRRRHRARPPARRHRRHPHHQGRPRARSAPTASTPSSPCAAAAASAPAPSSAAADQVSWVWSLRRSSSQSGRSMGGLGRGVTPRSVSSRENSSWSLAHERPSPIVTSNRSTPSGPATYGPGDRALGQVDVGADVAPPVAAPHPAAEHVHQVVPEVAVPVHDHVRIPRGVQVTERRVTADDEPAIPHRPLGAVGMQLRAHPLRLDVVEVQERRLDAGALGHRLRRVVMTAHAPQPTDTT